MLSLPKTNQCQSAQTQMSLCGWFTLIKGSSNSGSRYGSIKVHQHLHVFFYLSFCLECLFWHVYCFVLFAPLHVLLNYLSTFASITYSYGFTPLSSMVSNSLKSLKYHDISVTGDFRHPGPVTEYYFSFFVCIGSEFGTMVQAERQSLVLFQIPRTMVRATGSHNSRALQFQARRIGTATVLWIQYR